MSIIKTDRQTERQRNNGSKYELHTNDRLTLLKPLVPFSHATRLETSSRGFIEQ
jgi:hypothetical protein